MQVFNLVRQKGIGPGKLCTHRDQDLTGLRIIFQISVRIDTLGIHMHVVDGGVGTGQKCCRIQIDLIPHGAVAAKTFSVSEAAGIAEDDTCGIGLLRRTVKPVVVD